MTKIDEAPRKKPINSRAKGVRGELEFAKALTAAGYPATRGQQHAGGSESPDVRCESLRWIHWEIKRTATCQMFSPAQVAQWEAQARRDARTIHPIIVHRWDGSRQWWVRVMTSGRGPYWQTLDDFLAHVEQFRLPA